MEDVPTGPEQTQQDEQQEHGADGGERIDDLPATRDVVVVEPLRHLDHEPPIAKKPGGV